VNRKIILPIPISFGLDKVASLTPTLEHLGALTGLVVLDLRRNALATLPNAIGRLSALRSLNVAHNKLSAVADDIGNLSQLETLDVSYNELTALPGAFGRLGMLKSLKVAHNKLSAVPDEIGNLSQLEILDVSWNKLIALPGALGRLGALKSLNVADNKLSAVPDEIGNLSQLETLDVSYNELIALPAALGRLSALNSLYVNHNKLSAVPDEIGNLSQLEILNVSYNELTALPRRLKNLTLLQSLNVSSNQLTTLPWTLGHQVSLQFLFIHDNPFISIPVELTQLDTDEIKAYLRGLAQGVPMHACKVLLVGDGGIGKSTLLNTLFPATFDVKYFGKTAWYTLPTWLPATLRFEARQLTGKTSVYAVLTKILNDAEKGAEPMVVKEVPISNVKVTVAGRLQLSMGAVGSAIKVRCTSNLQSAQLEQVMRLYTENSVPTTGIEVRTIAISGTDLPANSKVPTDATLYINAWDFAGQPVFQNTHHYFLTRRCVYLVLWDVTPSSQEKAAAELLLWLGALKVHTGLGLAGKSEADARPTVIVVGNKRDTTTETDQQLLGRLEAILRAAELTIRDVGCAFVSARTGDNVSVLRTNVFEAILKMQHLGELVPSNYPAAFDKLCTEQEQFEHEFRKSYDAHQREFISDCAPIFTRLKCGDRLFELQEESPELETALHLFHEWGMIVYLGHGLPDVRDAVVYVPNWLTHSILGGLIGKAYRLAADATRQGLLYAVRPFELSEDDLNGRPGWKHLPRPLVKWLLGTLTAMDVLIPIANNNIPAYLLPLALPWAPALPTPSASSLIWPRGEPNQKTVVLMLDFNGLPMGLPGLLAAMLHRTVSKMDIKASWRYAGSACSPTLAVTYANQCTVSVERVRRMLVLQHRIFCARRGPS